MAQRAFVSEAVWPHGNVTWRLDSFECEREQKLKVAGLVAVKITEEFTLILKTHMKFVERMVIISLVLHVCSVSFGTVLQVQISHTRLVSS